jgi:ankyrin repeat protein
LYNASARGHLDLVYYLLALPSVKIDQTHTGERSLGSTALHAASFHGHEHVVGLLLLTGANAEIQNKFGLTADREAGIKVRQIFDLWQKGGKKALKKRFPTLHQPKIKHDKKLLKL